VILNDTLHHTLSDVLVMSTFAKSTSAQNGAGKRFDLPYSFTFR